MVGRADHVLALRKVSAAHLIELLATVRAVDHSLKHWHLTHRSPSASAVPDFLHSIERVFISDSFVCPFEDLPLGQVVLDGLLQLVGLFARLEIHGAAEIFPVSKQITDRTGTPFVRASGTCAGVPMPFELR